MTTTSDLAPTVTAAHRGAGKEAFAHVSENESLAMIPSLILELSVKITCQVALLEASARDPAQGPTTWLPSRGSGNRLKTLKSRL